MSTIDRTKFQTIRGVIIDLDGTMVHTAPDFHVAINRMRAEFALAPLSVETIIEFVGKGSENLIQRVLAVDFAQDLVDTHFDRALQSYQRHYLEINGQFSTTYPGVIEGLERMRELGLKLACVTNKPISFARPLLEKKGLASYFELVYGGDSLPRKKPDPLPMLTVSRAFALEPQHVLAIGDSSNDAEAARSAGCRVVSVPYGYNHGQPVHTIDSDGIVDSLLVAAHLIAA